MNIPRQLFGMNYITKILGNSQNCELDAIPQMQFSVLNGVTPVPLQEKPAYELGVSAARLNALLRSLSNQRLCALDGISIARGENMILSGYRPPYEEQIGHISNSACKTIIAIAVMFAISDGLLKEDDLVLSFFPEYASLLTPKFVRQIKVYHLLTMTTGSKTSELTAAVEENWVKAFLLTDCQFEPGSKFIYNSMNTYMLSALLCKVTQMSVLEYLKPRLLVPLGISNVKWELCPEGMERGGWGMHISVMDMVKIGIFLAQDGSFHGKQLIPASYIRKMKQVNIFQDVDDYAVGYGYQFWHLPGHLYMLSGMYGQHVIIDDRHHFVVAVNAHSDKMFPDSELTRTIVECMLDEDLYRTKGILGEKVEYHTLKQEMEMFCKGYFLPKPGMKKKLSYERLQRKNLEKNARDTKELLLLLHEKRLHMEQDAFPFFTYLMQAMYQYPSFQIRDVALKVKDNQVRLCFYGMKDKKETAKRECLILLSGISEYMTQTLFAGADKKTVALKFYCSKDEDGHDVLLLDIVFPAEGFSRLIKLFFLENRIAVEIQEYPDIRAIMEHYIYGDTSFGGATIDLTDKLPESVRVFLEYKVEPRLNAKLI